MWDRLVEFLNALWPHSSFLVVAAVIGFLLSALQAFLVVRIRRKPAEQPPLEKQLAKAIHALEQNSQEASRLLTLLQNEVATRTHALKDIETNLNELQQQRALLELTEEQKKAVESLVRRRPSTKDIFTSKEFWLGRVLPSAIFFLLGIIVTYLIRRP